MPTGYTTKLYEGEDQSFTDFALGCAHAFGTLVTLREQPIDALVPTIAIEGRYVTEVENARWRYELTSGWTDYDAEVELKAARQAREQYERDVITHSAALRERYEAMLVQVEAWIPPTSDHQRLKDFMIKQLRESIQFDCPPPSEPGPMLTPGEYRVQQLDKARAALAAAEEALQHERWRVTQANNWIRLLRESLP